MTPFCLPLSIISDLLSYIIIVVVVIVIIIIIIIVFLAVGTEPLLWYLPTKMRTI